MPERADDDPAGGADPAGTAATVAAGSGPPRAASAVALGLDTAPPRRARDGAAGADYAALQPVAMEHYAIEAAIAEGGMGRVVRARDRRLGRDVALKQIRASAPELAARLEREARLTARLQHPSIVAVHEAGVWPDGEPFYAMELVAGRPLDAVLAATKTTADRLALLPNAIAVADALAYAHSRRIIHRDLKPGNVLIGEFGETVVIDWGLAKDLTAASDSVDGPRAIRAAGETAYGEVMGTPAYMPPEQARGEPVDERADVYAIGALLFHLLSGKPPYAGRTGDEVIDLVLASQPAARGALPSDVPVDLVAIVDKAMAADAAARYPTARELAEDLRRFQTGQLVGARRYSAAQRVRRWLARHRVVATAAALIAVLSTVAIIRIVRERDAALAARRDALDQRALAEKRRERAEVLRGASESLVDFMVGDLEPQLARLGRLEVMRGLSTEIDGYYERLAHADVELDDASRARRAGALRTLGDVLDDLGSVDAARRNFEAAVALGDALGPDHAVETARARIGLALTLAESGDVEASRHELERVRGVLEANPHAPGAALALAIAYRRTGILAGSGTAARGAYATAVTYAVTAALAAPNTREPITEAAASLDRLCDVALSEADVASARRHALAGLALREQFVATDPGDLRMLHGVIISHGKLFRIALRDRDFAAAQRYDQLQVALGKQLVERDPDNTQWLRVLTVAHMQTSELAHELGQRARAADAIGEAVALADRQLAVDPENVDRLQDLAHLLGTQANFLVLALRLDEALPAAQRAVATSEALLARVEQSDKHHAVANAYEYLGDVRNARGELAEAAASYVTAIEHAETALKLAPDDAVLALALSTKRFDRGEIVSKIRGRRDEGIALMETGLAEMYALRDADRLTPRTLATVPEYEERLARAKRKR
jgi:tetratricopeptide (TPR) repeat protein/tRNA A-37 threonylcarbamoyl transferase component Bud32